MSSANTQSSGKYPSDTQGSSVRGKTDPTWNHFMEGRDDQGKKIIHAYIVRRYSKVVVLTE